MSDKYKGFGLHCPKCNSIEFEGNIDKHNRYVSCMRCGEKGIEVPPIEKYISFPVRIPRLGE